MTMDIDLAERYVRAISALDSPPNVFSVDGRTELLARYGTLGAQSLIAVLQRELELLNDSL